MLKVQKLILLLSLISAPVISNGQQRSTVISINEFSELSLDGKKTIANLLYIGTDWSVITDNFGSPSDTECLDPVPRVGLKEECSFLYNGLYIQYASSDDEVYLNDIIISSDTHYIGYNGSHYTVGDPITKLDQIFSGASEKRIKVELHNGEVNHVIRLDVENTSMSIAFSYDPISENITEISFFNTNL